jgi:hypothetical protein
MTGGELIETDETRAFRWVTAVEVEQLSTQAFGVRVLDAMRDTGIPAIRHHDGVHLLGPDGTSR